MKKKYYLVIALILLAGLSKVNGQESLLVDPAEIDSLQLLIKSNDNESKEKVRLLNEYARLCFYNQDYKEGLIAAKEGRELSKEVEFEGGVIMYHITMGVFSMGMRSISRPMSPGCCRGGGP